MRRYWLFSCLILLCCFFFTCCLGPVDPINRKRGLAIRGYDPVAFFTEGRAVEGDEKITYHWMDAEWRFASEMNRDLFAAEPEKYAPQFGGYCAYAAAQGRVYDANPQFWRIVDGKLYLNYDESAQEAWEENLESNIEKGDKAWPSLVKKADQP